MVQEKLSELPGAEVLLRRKREILYDLFLKLKETDPVKLLSAGEGNNRKMKELLEEIAAGKYPNLTQSLDSLASEELAFPAKSDLAQAAGERIVDLQDSLKGGIQTLFQSELPE
ncbi:MAG: hypothetical protein WC745_05040 [Patescibacteria group bacterium]|jgi:hypothetical protein